MRRNQFKKKWGRYPSLLWPALIVLVSACAHTDKDDPNKDNLENFSFPIETKITIGTAKKTVNETLKNESSVVQVLDNFKAVGNNLKKKIENLQKANGDATTGLGGIYGHIFLEDAKRHLTGSNWNSNVSVTQDVFGQITDYSRDENTGAGLLHVTTVVVSTLRNPGHSTNIKTVAYHWQVEVDPGGFSVHKNCHKFTDVQCDPTQLEQPFPGTMTFDSDMLQTVIDRDFYYKLWAEGTKIKVIKVYRRNNPGNGIPAPPPASGNPAPWKLLSDSDGSPYKGLYTSTDASCIDMMTEGVPPTDMANLPPVPFYCLGRCDHPAIINSR